MIAYAHTPEALPALEVKLLMESRGFASSTRSAFSKTWSKLFQVGPYFVDLSCTAAGDSAKFAGQILFEDAPCAVQLSLLKDGKRLNPQLDETGSFSVAISKPGIHTLELNVGTRQFLIDDLALS